MCRGGDKTRDQKKEIESGGGADKKAQQMQLCSEYFGRFGIIFFFPAIRLELLANMIHSFPSVA